MSAYAVNKVVDRRPAVYIGMIEEIYFSNAPVSEDAVHLMKILWGKLQRGHFLNATEENKLESIYAFACR